MAWPDPDWMSWFLTSAHPAAPHWRAKALASPPGPFLGSRFRRTAAPLACRLPPDLANGREIWLRRGWRCRAAIHRPAWAVSPHAIDDDCSLVDGGSGQSCLRAACRPWRRPGDRRRSRHGRSQPALQGRGPGRGARLAAAGRWLAGRRPAARPSDLPRPTSRPTASPSCRAHFLFALWRASWPTYLPPRASPNLACSIITTGASHRRRAHRHSNTCCRPSCPWSKKELADAAASLRPSGRHRRPAQRSVPPPPRPLSPTGVAATAALPAASSGLDDG